MNFSHCLHVVLVIGKYIDVLMGIFLREGEGYVRGSFMEEFFTGKKIPFGGGSRISQDYLRKTRN